MYVYEIRSYTDISSVAQRFLVIKQIVDQHFSKVFSIFTPAIISRILSSALKFELSKVNYINEVSVFYINVKTKLVETFMTLENFCTKSLEVIALQIIKIKQERYLQPNYRQIFHIYFEYSTYTTIIQPQHQLIGVHGEMNVLSNL